jgi:hypothetical protein
MSCDASVHRKSTEKKGISWKVSTTAGIPLNRKSLASGSVYRGLLNEPTEEGLVA